VDAPAVFGELFIDDGDVDDALSEVEGGGDGVSEAVALGRADDEPVDHDFDVMFAAFGEFGGRVEVCGGAIDADAHESGGAEFVPERIKGFAFVSCDGRHDDDASSVGVVEESCDDFVEGLGSDGGIAGGAEGVAESSEEDAEVVVDFGGGADGGARGFGGGFLFDGDGGEESLDLFDPGFLEGREELAGVRGEGFDVAALPFRVEGIDGEGGFSGAGGAGADGHGVVRDLDIDIFEIILRSATDIDGFVIGLAGFGGCGATAARCGGDASGGGEVAFERGAGVADWRGDDLLWGSLGDDAAAGRAAFGSEVDDPVGGFDDIEVMFDDDDGVSGIDETVEDIEEFPDVIEVESCGGFIEDVEGATGGGPDEFACELDALGFATGEGG
jgi:hypothetical protein